MVESAGMWMKAKREYCCCAGYRIQFCFETSFGLKMSDETFIIFPGRKRAHVFVFPTTTPPNPPSVALVYTLQFFQYDNYVQWNYMCRV